MVKSIKMDCRVNIMLCTWGLVARLPFLSVCVCVCDREKEREKWAIHTRPSLQALCTPVAVRLCLKKREEVWRAGQQGWSHPAGDPKDPANSDIINHGPLEDYGWKYRIGNHYRLGWQLKPRQFNGMQASIRKRKKEEEKGAKTSEGKKRRGSLVTLGWSSRLCVNASQRCST